MAKKHKNDFGMSGDQIFRALDISLDLNKENADIHMLYAHTQMMWLYARAIACHCECLGMNAENAMAVCGDYTPPYHQQAYMEVMQKWGLTDEKGNSII